MRFSGWSERPKFSAINSSHLAGFCAGGGGCRLRLERLDEDTV